MKPLAVFLSDEKRIRNAYSESTLERLSEELDFIDGFYKIDAFRDGRDLSALKGCKYAFSTWGMPALTGDEIDEFLPNLKAVFYAAGSVQFFARPFLNKGISVFSAWAANGVPVAETTVSEIILANKGFFQRMHRTGDKWTEHDCGNPYPGTYNTAVGIIGAGMIGSLVCEMLKNYRVNVLVYDPFLTDEKAEKLGVTKIDSLPELFRRCQVVSNHLANNAQTVGMIDKRSFNEMADNGVFINTGRGAQVVEKDLVAALTEKPCRAAVLDVTFPEPPAENSPLYTMPNVFLTPHLAGSIGNEVARMGEYMMNEFLAFTSGAETKYRVTEKMLETMA